LTREKKSGRLQDSYGEQLRLARRCPRGAFSFCALFRRAFVFREFVSGKAPTMKSQKRSSETRSEAMPRKKNKAIDNFARSSVESPDADIDASIAASTETPLEYMLRVMRDPSADDARRDAMAKAALPYMHARPTSVDGPVADNGSGEGRTVTFTWKPVQD
jgi:hypothetical protein